jgi:hypothetical protein
MTKQQYYQIIAYWKAQVRQAERNIIEANNDFIRDNAPHPIGSELRIDHIGKERKVRIQSYDIDENGTLTPVFESLEGKGLFIEKSTIIDFLNLKK